MMDVWIPSKSAREKQTPRVKERYSKHAWPLDLPHNLRLGEGAIRQTRLTFDSSTYLTIGKGSASLRK